MVDWVQASLVPLLGRALSDVDSRGIERLLGVGEQEVLDFKRQLPEATDSAKRKLCLDLAAFANAGGGLLVFGIDERAGVAHALVPLEPDPARAEIGLWINQVALSRIEPPLRLGVQVVPVAGGDVALVSVPPSPLSPHAVVTGDGLVFKTRSAGSNRTLSEHEVADLYRARFLSATDMAQRGEQAHRDLQARIRSLGPAPYLNSTEAEVWLAVSATPDQPSFVPMTRRLASSWESDLLRDLVSFPTHERDLSLVLTPQCKSMLIGRRDRLRSSTIGSLGLDGDSRIAQALDMSVAEVGEGRTAAGVRHDLIVADLMNLVQACVKHALRCGVSSNLTLTASLMVVGECDLLRLIDSDGRHRSSPVYSSIEAMSPTPPVSRSTEPASVANDLRERMELVRLLAGDLHAHFGIPEPLLFDDSGELVPQRLPPQLSHRAAELYELESGRR